jgi:hypothetical protein
MHVGVVARRFSNFGKHLCSFRIVISAPARQHQPAVVTHFPACSFTSRTPPKQDPTSAASISRGRSLPIGDGAQWRGQ